MENPGAPIHADHRQLALHSVNNQGLFFQSLILYLPILHVLSAEPWQGKSSPLAMCQAPGQVCVKCMLQHLSSLVFIIRQMTKVG